MLDRVTHLEFGHIPSCDREGARPRPDPVLPEGWVGARRGYLRAEKDLQPNDWFFASHFKGDPCMPGTLMFEGGVQALSIYMAALGLTLDRDGWRFEPVPGRPMTMRCRGQATPESRQLVYELFIESVCDGGTPMIIADLLCSVDGVKAFHCRGLALRLVPDWPLEALIRRQAAAVEPRPSASVQDVRGDYAALLACAWGRLASAFGPGYARLDGSGTVLRLPGPPYLCISRITAMPPEPGIMETGASVEAELDIDPAAWFFAENGAPVMPHCVLLEAALQPCGWLATFMGCPLASAAATRFRNLEGKGVALGDVHPDGGTLTTRATVTRLSRLGATILIGFEAECGQGERPVYRLETLMGFFPPATLTSPGSFVPDLAADALFALPEQEVIDLRARPDAFLGGSCRLARGKLLMLDRITGLWPSGGRERRGALRAEADVDPRAWFFKAHFFQDPVQPGSLALEAMLQLVQVHMLHTGMQRGVPHPRFQSLAGPMEWKHRGQVLPTDRCITLTAEIVDAGVDATGPYAIADASFWVEGRRIHEAKGVGMRIVSDSRPGHGRSSFTAESQRTQSSGHENGPPDLDLRVHCASAVKQPDVSASPDPIVREFTFDPEAHPWVKDHCPTFVLPTMPLMGMADLLAETASASRPGWVVTEVRDVEALSWLVCDRPRRLRLEAREIPLPSTEDRGSVPAVKVRRAAFEARLLALDGNDPRGQRIAAGTVILAEDWLPSPPPPPPAEGEAQPNPYQEERMFHGPAFQYLRSLHVGATGSTALMDPSAGWVEEGTLGPGLLDAATHGIPGESLHQWCADLNPEAVAYPRRLRRLQLYGPAPAEGVVRAEARFAGLLPGKRPVISVVAVAGQRQWAALRLEFVCLPRGPLGGVAPAQRAAFLRDRQFIPGASLSRREGTATVLDRRAVALSDWLPGTVAAVYAADPAGDLCRQVAVKEHVARAWKVHPSVVQWREGSSTAVLPAGRHPVRLREDGNHVVVEDAPGKG